MSKQTDYDLAYRSDSYWNFPAAPWARIKGHQRRNQVRDAFEKDEEGLLFPEVIEESIPFSETSGMASEEFELTARCVRHALACLIELCHRRCDPPATIES